MFELTDLRRMRKLLGLTQAELAKLSEVSQSLIAKIEAGKVDPSYTRTKKIFEILESFEKKAGRCAKDIMEPTLITTTFDAPVSSAVKIMHAKAISQLPILKGDEVIGSLSEKNLVEKIASGDGVEDILTKRVDAIMDDPFPTVSEDAPLELVAKMLNYYGAVLVYSVGRPAGIVTRSDLLRKS